MEILDPNGKPVQSERFAPCPKCGQGPKVRVASAGFGEPYLICPCGHEFQNLKVQQVTP